VPRKPQTLTDFEEEFRREHPTLVHLLPQLDRAEFPVSHIHRGRGARGEAAWLIQVKPEEHLRQSFGLAPEVLVLLLPANEAQARDIESGEQELERGLRLDPGVVLVMAIDPKARDRLGPATQRTGRKYLFIELEAFLAASDPRPWLMKQMRSELGAADLFASGPPVTGWDFFGRVRESDQLRRYFDAGKPVGLYGLRKIGKTSLALHTFNDLIKTTGAICIHLDLLALVGRSLASLMRHLLLATGRALGRLDMTPEALGLEVSLTAKHLRRIDDERVTRLGFEILEGAIDWAEDANRRVFVFIDEYERLFDEELFPVADAQRILDHLRGLVQLHPGRFNFMFAGLTRRFAVQTRLGRRQNPLFNFAAELPLPGLTEDELRQLLNKIGRRAGLKFSKEARSIIWQQSGGHPALAREFGRLIDRGVSLEERLSRVMIPGERARGLLTEFAVQVAPTMTEMHEAVCRVDERALPSLVRLAGSPGTFDASVGRESVEQLRRLGIITHAKGGWEVSIGCFADWLRGNFEQPVAARA
jgi:hypothetical protein